jgi:hypothetical protein
MPARHGDQIEIVLLRLANPCAAPEPRLTEGLQTVIDPDPPGDGNSHEIHPEGCADDCVSDLMDCTRLQDVRRDVPHEGQMKDHIAPCDRPAPPPCRPAGVADDLLDLGSGKSCRRHCEVTMIASGQAVVQVHSEDRFAGVLVRSEIST